MTSRKGRPFYPIETSTAPSFNSSAIENASTSYALESASRIWQGPSNRAVRTANFASTVTYYVKFGSSTVVAASSDSFLCIGAWPTDFYVSPSQTYIGLFTSATATVNVTLGYGG